jgi:hypothetical protein
MYQCFADRTNDRTQYLFNNNNQLFNLKQVQSYIHFAVYNSVYNNTANSYTSYLSLCPSVSPTQSLHTQFQSSCSTKPQFLILSLSPTNSSESRAVFHRRSPALSSVLRSTVDPGRTLDQHTVLYTHSDQFSPVQYPAPIVPNSVLVFQRLSTALELLQIPFVAGIPCHTSDVVSRHVYLFTPSNTRVSRLLSVLKACSCG